MKRDEVLIERIYEEIVFIGKTMQNKTKEIFLHDDILQHAICMSIISIGECANHLSENFKLLYDEIEWVQIIGVRNIAAHGYWQLSMEQVWQAWIFDIPKLKNFCKNILKNE